MQDVSFTPREAPPVESPFIKFKKGKRLTMRELAYMARYHPEMVRKKYYTTEAHPPKPPPKLPPVTSTTIGLHVARKIQEKSLTQRLLETKIPSVATRVGWKPSIPKDLFRKRKDVSVTEPVAGFVASFESPVYSIGRLLGVKTPTPPPSIISKYAVEHPHYFTGALTGEVIQSVALGKAIEKGFSPVQRRASKWLTRKYIEKGPLAWKGIKEKAVMKLTGAKPHLARQIVSVPSPTTPTGAFRAMQSYTFLQTPRTAGLEIGGTMGKSKRVQQWAMETWIKRVSGGLSYALVKEELTRPRAELPYIPTVKPLKATLPKIPVGLAVAGVIGLKTIRLPEVEPFEEEKPIPTTRMVQQFKKLTRTKVTPSLKSVKRQAEKLRKGVVVFPTVKADVISETYPVTVTTPTTISKAVPVQKARTVTFQLTKTTTILKAVTVPKIVYPTDVLKTPVTVTPKPLVPSLYRGVSIFDEMKKRKYKGKWYLREHPIPTAEQMAKKLGF